MMKPIERVYVIENGKSGAEQVSGFDENQERAATFAKATGSTVRVFVEERPWITDRAPDSSREVQAVYASGWPTGPRPRVITAVFGSEGKWVAVDHDYRRTYLDQGTVLAWRELSEVPEFPGTHWPTGWR